MPADALRQLLARIEAASECSRELDAELWRAFGAPHLSTSLDAVVALCERILPEACWHAFTDMGAAFAFVEIWRDSRWVRFCDDVAVDGRTPALALCIAIVKAKLAEP